MSESKGMSLSAKIFLGMILGAVAGLILNFLDNPLWSQVWLTDGIFNVVGSVFISLLKMLVVPLVFVSIVCGTSALADPKALGRVGGKAIGLYLITTGIAVVLALSAAAIFQPGVGANPTAMVDAQINEGKPFTQVLDLVGQAQLLAPHVESLGLQVLSDGYLQIF